MLEVALGPSSVARGEVDQRGGAFLEAAAERREHVDRPASPAHQRRLHEIMAQDMTAERRPPRQIGHPAMIGERARANKVLRLTISGRLWTIPASGSASIVAASRTIASAVIKLSASRMTAWG